MSRYILNEVSYHGKGSLENIRYEIENRKFRKAFICTDKILVDVKVVEKVTKILDKMEFPYEIFTDLQPNPSVKNIQDGINLYQKSNADFIIAIGGGSPQDTAKGIGIVINNPEFSDIVSLEGVANTKNKAVPMIAIPTTSGTASEVTINYVVTITDDKRKIVCVDPNCIPIVAIVDPNMMETMPKSLLAATGMDALTHAIEGYITLGADEMSDMFHSKAIELIYKSLKNAFDGDEKALEKLALGQYIAGMGFSNVGLGAVHSMAHPLGALYGTPHGIANAIILPTVMKFNAPATGDKFRGIAKAMNLKLSSTITIEEVRKKVIEAVKNLSASVEIPSSLSQIVKKDDIDFLSQSAYDDACRPGNPREITKKDFIKLYESLI